MKDKLLDIMKENYIIAEGKLCFDSIPCSGLTLQKIREKVIGYGSVEVFDENSQCMIVFVNHGLSRYTNGLIGIQIVGNSIDIISSVDSKLFAEMHAKNQKESFIKILHGEKKSKKLILPVSLVVIALTSSLLYNTSKSDRTPIITPSNTVEMKSEEDELRVKYVNIVTNYNTLVTEYNKISSNLYIEGIENVRTEALLIQKDAEYNNWTKSKLESNIDVIVDEFSKLMFEYGVINQISNIDEKFIEEGYDHVTEDNDPNKMLNIDGGYVSCVYFTLSSIPQEVVKGDTIIEKGTDAGGAIEIYRTVEDAKQRVEYLKSFDNTLIVSGSYDIIGTVVIRTSYLLSKEDQVLVTSTIKNYLAFINE